MIRSIIITVPAIWYLNIGYCISRNVIHHRISGAVIDAAL
jgi:hypothetical protein